MTRTQQPTKRLTYSRDVFFLPIPLRSIYWKELQPLGYFLKVNAKDNKYFLKVSAKRQKYMMTDKSQSNKKNSGGSGGIPPGKDVNSFLFWLFVPIIGTAQSSVNRGRIYGTLMDLNVFNFTLFFARVSPFSQDSRYQILLVPTNLGHGETPFFCEIYQVLKTFNFARPKTSDPFRGHFCLLLQHPHLS